MFRKKIENNENAPLLADVGQPLTFSTAPSKNDGVFEQVPTEVIAYIAALMNLQSMAQFSQTNRRMYMVTSCAAVMIEETDKETGENKRLPSTYAVVRNKLNVVMPKQWRLQKLDNDPIDAKIFRKNPSCALLLPLFSCLGLMVVGGGVGVGLVASGRLRSNNDDMKVAFPLIFVPAVSSVVGVIGCLYRRNRINKETQRLNSEISAELPRGLNV